MENIFLPGNFYVDLLKYDKNGGTNEFPELLSAYMFLLHILHPTRVTGHSQTIMDNTFSNCISKEAVCCNITSSISDHLPQMLFTDRLPPMLFTPLLT